MSLINVTNISTEEFNRMDKNVLYRQIEQVSEDIDQVMQWLKYRGTPGATVYRYARPTGNGVVWRIKV